MNLKIVAYGFAFLFAVRFTQCDKTVEAKLFLIPFLKFNLLQFVGC